ncbi:MAG TPA: DNA circularization N-terminal domain-containing protein [Chthoniobacterales bacterium]|nr:DNA circularization N-terminal domain-containing protein [Chthoniobacterales bacterium]
MASIFQIPNTPWRDALIPASFRGAEFHIEAHGLETGRRLVVHEFPKRDYPYTEDMGHKAISWSVRGYCIAYPVNISGSDLYQRDYRTARDALYRVLAAGLPGMLQVQTLPPMNVWCQRFRLTEEERLGGYCVFDMTFVESGVAPFALEDTSTTLINRSSALRDIVMNDLNQITTGQIPGFTPPQLFITGGGGGSRRRIGR